MGDAPSDGQRYRHHPLHDVARRFQGRSEFLVFVSLVFDLLGNCVVQAVPDLHDGDLILRLRFEPLPESNDVWVVVFG